LEEKPIDKLAEFRKEDPDQLDLFHYVDDPTVSDEKLPKLNENENKS